MASYPHPNPRIPPPEARQWHLLCLRAAGIPATLEGAVPQMPVRADGSWAAPFALVSGGRQFVFFEETLPGARARTRISLLETDGEGRAAIVRPVAEHEESLAAPFVFNWQERFWLVAVRGGVPWLHRCLRWPERWQAEKPLLGGIFCSSASLHWHGERWWLWLTVPPAPVPDGAVPPVRGGTVGSGGERDDGHAIARDGGGGNAGACGLERIGARAGSGSLQLYSAKHFITSQWQPHPLNAGGAGVFHASAGSVFTDGSGRLLRPVRSGGCECGAGDSAGETVALHHITCLTPEQYAEVPLASFHPPAGRTAIRTLNIGAGCLWADGAF